MSGSITRSRSNFDLTLGRMFSVLAVCLVVSSIIASVISSLTVTRGSVVVIGDRVEMKCSVTGSDSASWTYTSWNTSTETDIYLGTDIIELMRSRYKIDKNISGQHNLIIDSVDLAHAGRYKCTTIMQKSRMNDMQLTVLVSPPNCSSHTSNADRRIMENGYLWMVCRIIYRPAGNITPIFTWTKDNTTNVIVANTTTASDNSTVTLTTISSVLVQVHSDDNGATFKCKITIQLLNNTKVYATDYEYTWNHTVYEPTNLSIVEHKDRLECSADGNPTPTYRWTDVETSGSTEGPAFILDASYDKNHTFQCIAYNILGAKNKNVTVAGHPKDTGLTQDISYFLITALAIGGSLLFLLTTAIIASCVVHRKRLKDDRCDRPDVALNTDINSYDDIALSSERSPNYNPEGSRLPGKSDDRKMADNTVYAEVCKPKGQSKGSKGGNIGVKSRPLQTPTRERQIVTGADGTVYAELSGVKPPARKGEVPKVPKLPAFSQVEIYAAIDHSGKVPAPPLLQK